MGSGGSSKSRAVKREARSGGAPKKVAPESVSKQTSPPANLPAKTRKIKRRLPKKYIAYGAEAMYDIVASATEEEAANDPLLAEALSKIAAGLITKETDRETY